MVTSREICELRQLVEQHGFLPIHGKARSILQEIDRLSVEHGLVATCELREMQEELQKQGYLPATKARRLLSGIEALRT